MVSLIFLVAPHGSVDEGWVELCAGPAASLFWSLTSKQGMCSAWTRKGNSVTTDAAAPTAVWERVTS